MLEVVISLKGTYSSKLQTWSVSVLTFIRAGILFIVKSYPHKMLEGYYLSSQPIYSV